MDQEAWSSDDQEKLSAVVKGVHAGLRAQLATGEHINTYKCSCALFLIKGFSDHDVVSSKDCYCKHFFYHLRFEHTRWCLVIAS